jgi:O-antigen/teichoic acid export membrane protein
LGTNLIGLIINLVTQAIIPRGLGPRAYGDFNFLSNFFSQVMGFLDMGTSIGFYTKLSQRQREFGLVSFYFGFGGIIVLLLLFFIVLAQLSVTFEYILPDQKIFYIYLAAFWGILTWMVQLLNQMADAYGLTVSAEIARMLQKTLGLVLITSLFFLHQLNLRNFFFYHYTILVPLVFAFVWIMEHKGFSFRQSWKLSGAIIRGYIKEFYDYSHPLFVYSLVALLAGVLDRWLLQFFSGSVEQGFYGLSYQVGAICFLFTSAMTPLLTREFAIAYDVRDLPEMARLFRRYVPMLYAISAYFACFVAVEADKVTYIMGGERFQYAALPVTIMAFYPIYQTYGQLGGSVFYATGHTALYRNIGLISLLLGIPVAYFLIAPKDRLGLNAGATGLAIKMVVQQFIGVNVLLYFVARLLGLRFWRYMWHQLGCVAIFVVSAVLAGWGIDQLFVSSNKVVAFVASGITYTALVAVLALLFPIVFGLSRNDIERIKNLVLEKLMHS